MELKATTAYNKARKELNVRRQYKTLNKFIQRDKDKDIQVLDDKGTDRDPLPPAA